MPDDIHRLVRGEDVRMPVAELIGFTVERVAREYALVTLDVGERHRNPMGTLHGGILCDIADTAMGLAYASGLGDTETFTTLELKINFLRPVFDGRLRAEGRVVKSGRTIGMAECDILDAENRLVARASSTCMTLRGEQAQGR